MTKPPLLRWPSDAGGTIKSAQTTKLLSGDEWVVAPVKAADVVKAYEPAR